MVCPLSRHQKSGSSILGWRAEPFSFIYFSFFLNCLPHTRSLPAFFLLFEVQNWLKGPWINIKHCFSCCACLLCNFCRTFAIRAPYHVVLVVIGCNIVFFGGVGVVKGISLWRDCNLDSVSSHSFLTVINFITIYVSFHLRTREILIFLFDLPSFNCCLFPSEMIFFQKIKWIEILRRMIKIPRNQLCFLGVHICFFKFYLEEN